MRNDVIVCHETWQSTNYLEFLASHFKRNGNGNLPDIQSVKGELFARINHGRWLIDCPNADCNSAIVASEVTKVFICPDCGSPENAGKWYQAVFPIDKKEIETELLKRPARDGFRAINRNWSRSETVMDLKEENKQRGIK